MDKIYFQKSIVASVIATIAIVLSVLAGCQSDLSGLMDDSCCAKFTVFEKEFVKTLSSEKDVVKLIGFKTYEISDAEKQHFRTLESEFGKDLKQINTVFSDDFSFYRVYFPLHTAIVEYNGKTYTADEKGVVSIPNLKDISKVKIIGRKRSETVHGTGSNIIEKDHILLKNEFIQEVRNGVELGYSIDENACIFDFKALTSMNASCCSNSNSIIASMIPRLKSGYEGEEEEDRVSCMENHGGGINCTIAFGIYQGRCGLATDHCMDYNGYLAEEFGCTGSHTFFVGSDCCVALSMGKCWNEL